MDCLLNTEANLPDSWKIFTRRSADKTQLGDGSFSDFEQKR